MKSHSDAYVLHDDGDRLYLVRYINGQGSGERIEIPPGRAWDWLMVIATFLRKRAAEK